MKTNNLLFLAVFLGLFAFSCQKDTSFSDTSVVPDLEHGTGGDINEDDSGTPQDINLNNGEVPSSYDLSDHLPPIGDQGQFGTCVAWALGYNLKTLLDAQDNNWTTSDLTDPARRGSAKDLFLSIDKANVGANCEGTWLIHAMDAMQNRGIATEDVVPYAGLGDCSQSASASGNQDASNHKISNYRKINIDVNTIKQYISADRPVGFGARLGDNFMNWNSDEVLTGHTSFDRVGIHAAHAMTIVGYDDNKGFGGAFKVINSWGESWGNRGFIWIDYQFFVSGDFCNVAYVATNQAGEIDPNDPTDPNANGQIDMVPFDLTDSDNPNGSSSKERVITYNVFNRGSETARASSDWSVAYLYYNAYDANDYGVLLYDYYTDDFGSPGQDGEMSSGPGISGNWWNHVDVQGGQSVTQAVSGSDENFSWPYQVPNITGYYYLVMIADPFGNLNEKDVANNFLYVTGANGEPIRFEGGVPQGMNGENSTRGAGAQSQAVEMAPSEISKDMSNAYTKTEIYNFLKSKQQNGQLRDAIAKYQTKKQK